MPRVQATVVTQAQMFWEIHSTPGEAPNACHRELTIESLRIPTGIFGPVHFCLPCVFEFLAIAIQASAFFQDLANYARAMNLTNAGFHPYKQIPDLFHRGGNVSTISHQAVILLPFTLSSFPTSQLMGTPNLARTASMRWPPSTTDKDYTSRPRKRLERSSLRGSRNLLGTLSKGKNQRDLWQPSRSQPGKGASRQLAFPRDSNFPRDTQQTWGKKTPWGSSIRPYTLGREAAKRSRRGTIESTTFRIPRAFCLFLDNGEVGDIDFEGRRRRRRVNGDHNRAG